MILQWLHPSVNVRFNHQVLWILNYHYDFCCILHVYFMKAYPQQLACNFEIWYSVSQVSQLLHQACLQSMQYFIYSVYKICITSDESESLVVKYVKQSFYCIQKNEDLQVQHRAPWRFALLTFEQIWEHISVGNRNHSVEPIHWHIISF